MKLLKVNIPPYQAKKHEICRTVKVIYCECILALISIHMKESQKAALPLCLGILLVIGISNFLKTFWIAFFFCLFLMAS